MDCPVTKTKDEVLRMLTNESFELYFMVFRAEKLKTDEF